MKNRGLLHFIAGSIVIISFLGGASLVNAGHPIIGITTIGISIAILITAMFIEGQMWLKGLEADMDERGMPLFSLIDCRFNGDDLSLVCYEKGFVITDGIDEYSEFVNFRMITDVICSATGLKVSFKRKDTPLTYEFMLSDLAEEKEFISICRKRNIEVQTDGEIREES